MKAPVPHAERRCCTTSYSFALFKESCTPVCMCVDDPAPYDHILVDNLDNKISFWDHLKSWWDDRGWIWI